MPHYQTMERESRKRVKIEQRPKSKPLKSRLNFTKDPPLVSSSARKRKAVRSPSPDSSYYGIRSIKKERRIKGKLQYLIDWTNNPVTNEVYPESWEPEENVTAAAIAEWESRNLEGSQGEARHSEHPSSSIKTDTSEPIRTGKRKEFIPKQKNSRRRKKKLRRAGTSDTARFQTISQESPSSPKPRQEIKDTYEDILPSSEPVESVSRVRVEIPPVPSTFNRAAYSPVDSSQPSQKEYSQNQTDLAQSQPETQSQTSQQTPNPRTEEEERSSEEPSDQPVEPSEKPVEPNSTPSSEPVFKLPAPPLRTKKVVIPDSQETASSPSRASVTQADIGTGSLVATTQSSSGDVDATVTSESQSPGSSSFIPASERSKDSTSQSVPPVSQSNLDLELSFREEETESAPQVESVEQELSLEEQGFQTQLPFSSQQQEDIEAEKSELVAEESHASQSNPIQQSIDKEIPETNESLDLECQQHQPSHLSGLVSSHQDISKLSSKSPEFPPQRSSRSPPATRLPPLQIDTSTAKDIQYPQPTFETASESSELPPQLSSRSPSASRLSPLQIETSTAEDIPSLQPSCEAASKSPSVPPQSNFPPPVDSNSLLAHNRQPSAPIHSDSLVQPNNVANTRFSSVSRNNSPQSPVSRSTLIPLASQSLAKLGSEHLESSGSQKEERKVEFLVSSSVVRSIGRTPEIVSSSAMEDTSIFGDPTQDTRLLMKAARVKAAEKRAAERLAARSASTLPATPPAPAIPSQPLPLRETMVEKPAPAQVSEPPPSPKASERESEEPEVETDTAQKGLKILSLEENQFIIPLPLIASVRDTYGQTLRNNKQSRLDFVENENDVNAATDIDVMLDELEKICDHLDLIDNDYATQRKEPLDIQARYAETVSTKCIFIAELIMEMRKADKHLVILSRPGRMTEILEALLIRHEFSSTDGAANHYFDSRMDGSLQITLIELGSNLQNEQKWGPASLVVVFSSSSELNELSALRENPGKPLAPVVSLVVTHSIEHLNLCIDKGIPSNDRYLLLVDYLSQIQEEVGKLGPEYPSPPEAAKALATFIVDNDPLEQWPLAHMPLIEVIEGEARFQVGPYNARLMERQDKDVRLQARERSTKRQRTREGSGDDMTKRMRLSSFPTDESATHVSATQELSSTNGLLRASSTPAHGAMNEVLVLRKKVVSLERNLQQLSAKEARMRAVNDRLEARNDSLEQSINIIQPKFQEALNERAQFENDMDASIKRETELRAKHDSRFLELKRLKEAKKVVDDELSTAHQQLLISSIPSIVEMNQLKEAMHALQVENERLKKRQASLDNDLAFTRNQYQSASQSAGEAVSKNRILEAEVEDLRAAASENAVKIQEMARDSLAEQQTDRIRDLSGENDELVRELDRRTEEFRSSTHARRGGTRGTSVPRSPRMGAGTMSPGGPQRNINRVIGAGSRGNSPAPGELPARGIFGEAGHTSGSGAPGRWGNHLQ